MDNLALKKPALQSSTSPWSRSAIPAEDAIGANNGDTTVDWGCHTGREHNPWWQTDLGAVALVHRVVIFNRRDLADRLKNFSILASLDGTSWRVVFTKADEQIFGEYDGRPYVVELNEVCRARFIRLRLDGEGCLHVAEVQVFGEPDHGGAIHVGPGAKPNGHLAPAAEVGAATGRLVRIDGFDVSVDPAKYHPAIVHCLDNGSYEGIERSLVKKLLSPADRVIEIGTAVGVVAMTAAAVVGAENVLTFDANPEIVADARENFHRNGLGRIDSRVGVLKNRQAYAAGQDPVDFFISRAFWGSRLGASLNDGDIVKAVKVPVFCLEDEIQNHAANTMICDIEGGEVDLLTQADLAGINTIIIETHYRIVGKAPTDQLIRKLIIEGFSIDLENSFRHVLVLQR
jgi:FkbM family methyltransferase